MNLIQSFAVVLCGVFLIVLGILISPTQILYSNSQYKIGDCFEYNNIFYEVIQIGNYGSLEAINYSPQVSDSSVWSEKELKDTTKVDCFEMFEKKESK